MAPFDTCTLSALAIVIHVVFDGSQRMIHGNTIIAVNDSQKVRLVWNWRCGLYELTFDLNTKCLELSKWYGSLAH